MPTAKSQTPKTKTLKSSSKSQIGTPPPNTQTAPKKRGADEGLVNARLRALFPGAASKAEARERGEREVTGAFKMLPHSLITVRPQVRRTFAQAELDELRASIRELRAQNGGIEGSGVLQALLVSPLHDEAGVLTGYRLIAGEKRFRSTRDEGLPEIPCVIIPQTSESLVRLMQLTENALRTPPPVLEEAFAMRDTINEMELSLRDMARLMGKSLGYVTERVGLLKTGSDIQEMVFARANTLRHARLIEPVTEPALRADLIAAALEGAGEREIRRRIEAQQSSQQLNPQETARTSKQASDFPTGQSHTAASTVDNNNSQSDGKNVQSGLSNPAEDQLVPSSISDAKASWENHAANRSDKAVLQLMQPVAQSLQQAIHHPQIHSLNRVEKRQLRSVITELRHQLDLLEQSTR